MATCNMRDDEKALENAKWGKVTAGVVVVHIFDESKNNLPNAYVKNSAKKVKLGSKLNEVLKLPD